MSQIMALNQRTPDIQEHLLNLPPQEKGKPYIHEKRLRPLTAMFDWESTTTNMAENNVK